MTSLFISLLSASAETFLMLALAGIAIWFIVTILLAFGVIRNRRLTYLNLLFFVNKYGYDSLGVSHYVALFVKELIKKGSNNTITVEQITATHEIDGRYVITCFSREYGREQFYFVLDKSGSYTIIN